MAHLLIVAHKGATLENICTVSSYIHRYIDVIHPMTLLYPVAKTGPSNDAYSIGGHTYSTYIRGNQAPRCYLGYILLNIYLVLRYTALVPTL